MSPTSSTSVTRTSPERIDGTGPAEPRATGCGRVPATRRYAPRVDVLGLERSLREEGPRFVDGLRDIVSIDSGTYTPEGVSRVADWLELRFASSDWEVERRHDPGEEGRARLGDVLVARVGGRGTHRVVLNCHMDTVWPEGTVAERPFRVDGDRAYGPGVSDAKSGLLAGIEAVDALRRAGQDTFGVVTFVCNPDEEAGSPFSGSTLAEVAKNSDVAFVLEAGRENGDLVSQRKGLVTIRADFFGRAAHAGVEPERGRHAVLDAAT